MLAPRLQAMGADMSRIFICRHRTPRGGCHRIDPATDLPALERKAESFGGVRMLIVGPVVSGVGGESHKNAETRRSLQPLVKFAQRFDCAALGITHFSKGTGGREPIQRITGSLAFGALARVVLVAFKQPEDRPEGAPARDDGTREVETYPRTRRRLRLWHLIDEDLAGFPAGSALLAWSGVAPVDGTARE